MTTDLAFYEVWDGKGWIFCTGALTRAGRDEIRAANNRQGWIEGRDYRFMDASDGLVSEKDALEVGQ